MKLRLRLAIATVAVAVPVIVGVAWVTREAERHAEDTALAELARLRMDNGGRERCEANPEFFARGRRAFFMHRRRAPPPFRRPPPPGPRGFGPPGGPMHHPMRGVALFAYDAKLVSANPDAPPIGKTLREEAEHGADMASTHDTDGDRRIQRVLVRMSWSEGPCAFVLVERVLPPRPGLFAGLMPWPPLVVPVLVVLFAILVAIGPVVRRIRRLTGAVQAAARDGYKEGVVVEGSDEIAELARAFDGAGREIRAQMDEVASREEALRAFLENTTHDVMIPLTVLQGHLTALRDAAEAGESVPADKVRAAIDEAHYMASLVHNLGVAAKLEGGAPTLRHDPIDLGALVERAVARHRPLARGEDVALESGVPPEPVHALGDVTLAEQAVGNLLYNAVRYNRAGGHVAVTLSERGDRFAIEIVDDGPGIPAADLQRLQAREARGDDARERAPGGRGLGLDIARSVAEAHGWTLTLEPSSHGGLAAKIEGPVAD